MNKHTAKMPLPVKSTYREGQYCAYWEIVDAAGKRIAMTTETHAAYIVKAVNAHEALVEALKGLIAEYWMNKGSDGTFPLPHEFITCKTTGNNIPYYWRNAEAALKLAGEEVSNG